MKYAWRHTENTSSHVKYFPACGRAWDGGFWNTVGHPLNGKIPACIGCRRKLPISSFAINLHDGKEYYYNRYLSTPPGYPQITPPTTQRISDDVIEILSDDEDDDDDEEQGFPSCDIDLQSNRCASCDKVMHDHKEILGGSFDGICCLRHRVCADCWFGAGPGLR